MKPHTEAAFETVLEDSLLTGGYEKLDRNGFDRERAIFPQVVLAFIRATQAKQWQKLEALHGDKTGERILHDMPRSWAVAAARASSHRRRGRMKSRS